MSTSETYIPQIVAQKEKMISKEQKKFNRQTKKIHKLKSELEELERIIPKINQLVQARIRPVIEEIGQARIEFVKQLDQSYDLKFFRVREKEKLQAIILDQAYDLIQKGIEELEAIYDKHSEVSFQEEQQDAQEMQRDMAQSMFKNLFDLDVDLNDIDPDNFEEMGQRIREQAEAKQQQAEAKRKKRKKTPAQEAKEQRMKEEVQHISKTTRSIYMQLVKTHHPDQETDEAEQQRKTEIMQRVTQAYKNDDFFELLRLQLELLSDGKQKVEGLTDQQLKYYNKILKEQIDELQRQLFTLQNPPSMVSQTIGLYLKQPKRAKQLIERDRYQLEQELKQIKQDAEELADKHQLRAFLRDYEILREDDLDFFFFQS
ncbi:hypothetical protein [Tunicatimonas pelagia]|uniref:hypothetical protein n=1 Tax=Tunicatimonas pelagia TaxID=931531 RepID=UPI00266547C4|nr:hypothetical protein [Tunicatimonas pelagia]WKN42165.1 hypothetical protein P0M28_24315 [Tunicatimonas pelagia]